jgi:hypothetical protein
MSEQITTTPIETPARSHNPLQLFANRSLRAKLILAFLAITALSVGGVSFFTNRATQDTLTTQVSANLHGLAETRAQTVGNLIDKQVDLLESFGLSKVVQDGVEAVFAGYTGDPAAIRAGIEKLDKQWVAAADTDPLIQTHLNSEIASELKEYRDTFPDNVEVVVTDKFGALVAATDRTSDYNQAGAEWWRGAYNNGQGDTYIGQPQFDERSKTTSIVIALPLVQRGGNPPSV